MAVVLKGIRHDVKKAVYEALDLLGYVPSMPRVFIKPNIVNLFRPREPYITNPEVVGGIIDYLKDKGVSDITVGEGTVGKDTNRIFGISGYSRMCRRKGVGLIDLNDAQRIEKGFKDSSLSLPRIAFDREYINVSKLKTHIQTTVSLGLKNQKGLLGFRDRRRFHKDLHANIARLAATISPRLSVIDATNGVEGNGPGARGRKVKGINMLICGKGFLETDAVGVRFMGIGPEEVRHLVAARDLGIGSFDAKVEGEDLGSVKRRFLLPDDHHGIFNMRYWWTDETCSGCSSLMDELKREILKNPVLLMKLAYYGLFRRLDFIAGDLKEPPSGCGRVLCIGSCAKGIAERNSFPLASGCPPKTGDILDAIKTMLTLQGRISHWHWKGGGG